MSSLNENENIQSELSSEQALKLLGKELIEDLKTRDPNSLEIFERYSHALRLKMHFKEDEFTERLVKGYHALLDELKQGKPQ